MFAAHWGVCAGNDCGSLGCEGGRVSPGMLWEGVDVSSARGLGLVSSRSST